MDAACLPDGLPAALQELGMATVRAIGTTQARDALKRALDGRMPVDEAEALSGELLELARVLG